MVNKETKKHYTPPTTPR